MLLVIQRQIAIAHQGFDELLDEVCRHRLERMIRVLAAPNRRDEGRIERDQPITDFERMVIEAPAQKWGRLIKTDRPLVLLHVHS